MFLKLRFWSLNLLERIMVQHAHPVKLVLEVIGIMWAIYFLWQGNWQWAIVSGIGLPLLGTILVWGRDERRLTGTWLGKVMLMHAHPLNFVLHLVGFVPMVYGLWLHDTVYILAGLTAVILGHLWGWEKMK